MMRSMGCGLGRAAGVVLGALMVIAPAVAADGPTAPAPRSWQLGEAPAVRDVALGSSLDEVKRSLGPPACTTDSPRDDAMGMGEIKELAYEGLVVKLCKPDGASAYHVWRMELTGGQWTLSAGVRTGMTRAQVVAVLGEPESASDDGGTSTLYYSFRSFDGWLWVEVSGDKLTMVGLSEDWS